jgi:hypothetical protein
MKNFNDIIQSLISTNDKLIKGEIDIETAKVVAQNTQVLINAAKVTLDFAKFTGNKDDIFLGNEPIEITLKKIEIGNKKPYQDM